MSIVTPEEPQTAAGKDRLHKIGDSRPHHVHDEKIPTPLKIAIGSSFILRLAGAATGLLLGFYLKQVVQADANEIGLLAGVFYITELLLAPVFGALSDLRGRKFFLVIGPLIGAVAVQIPPLTTIIAILAAGRLLEGISTAANAPGTLGYLADATSGRGHGGAQFRGRVMGLYEISFLIGLVGGNFLGGKLWTVFGHNGFRLVSVVYLAAAAVLYFFIHESLPQEAREHHEQSKYAARDSSHPVRTLITSRLKSYSHLLKEPALRSFVPAWLSVNAVVGLWLVHISPLMVENLRKANPFENQLLTGHLAPEQVSWVLGGFGLFFMTGIYLWSRFYGRMRRTNMMLASLAGLFVICITLLGINNNVLPGPWGQWPLVPALIIGVMLESGFTPVALAYLADISETRVEHRGAVMGLYSVFLGIGQFVGSSTGGLFIVGLGFNGLILASTILGLVALLAVLYLRARHSV